VIRGPATVSGAMVTLTGAGAVTLGASQAATTDYAAATATTSFTVTPEVPTLSFAVIANQTYGVAPFTVTATSASSGAITYAVLSGPATLSGNTVTLTGPGTVTLSASQVASGNYAAATATTSFQVSSPFMLTAGASAGSASTTPGGTATFSLQLTPGSAGTLPDAISLTATGLPPGATSTFSPATIAAGSGPTTVTLTIQTSSQSAHSATPLPGGPLMPVMLGLLLPLLKIKSASKRLLRGANFTALFAFAALSLSLLVGLTGCGGGSTSNTTTPPAQTYTLVVTAVDQTSGVKSQVNLNLTLQ
jgi:hypothetical protein